MKLIRTLLILFCLSPAAKCLAQVTSLSFYIVSDQDQWQLFMGMNAFRDINAGNNHNRVVLVYLTAGDESCNGTLKPEYYLSRQEGANNTVEFCADKAGGHGTWDSAIATFAGHNILTYTYKNSVSYCFRLPGGCTGPGLWGQSLSMLHNSLITGIETVDSSAYYSGWADLANTLSLLLQSETAANVPEILVNIADTNQTLNPGDQPDHYQCSYLALEALKTLKGFNLNLFRENNIANLPPNHQSSEIATKAALLSILDYARTSNGQPTEWIPEKVNYTSRSYYRTLKL